LWYKIRFWVVRWLVGEVPSAGESGRGGATGGSGSEPSDRAMEDAAPPAGLVARRRRRRAHRRRRARQAADAGDAGVGAEHGGSTTPGEAAPLPGAEPDRWLAGRSPAASSAAPRADASHAAGCGHGFPGGRVPHRAWVLVAAQGPRVACRWLGVFLPCLLFRGRYPLPENLFLPCTRLFAECIFVRNTAKSSFAVCSPKNTWQRKNTRRNFRKHTAKEKRTAKF
jgi:hypothetical protein